MPTTPEDQATWLRAIFPAPSQLDAFVLENTFPAGVEGKKLSYVVERHLQPIRLRIAHAVVDSGELAMSPDDPDEEVEIIRWPPLTKCIARRLLKNEFPSEFLHYLREDGSVAK
jgi:hypothetical protein